MKETKEVSRAVLPQTDTGHPGLLRRESGLGEQLADKLANGLPAGVEELLVDVVADGFALYCCGDRAAPSALVACYEWDHYLDVVSIQNFDRITTARLPRRATVDPFAPDAVVWAYEGPPAQALRALLNLVHPAHPDAPIVGYPAPASLSIPRARQRPMTIRLPAPGRAGARHARLTTAMRTLADEPALSSAMAGAHQTAGWLSVEGATPDALLPAAGRPPG